MFGYMGKILRVDLTNRKLSTIDTRQYVDWGGGHGMGSAIFWDLCKDKAISGFDPGNVVTIMTSPLSGTIVPSATGRTELQGIAVEAYPIEWFTRSNFGGRFGSMLKYAGWDGIVVEGSSDTPVWLDIRDDNTRIRDAGWLWGWTPGQPRSRSGTKWMGRARTATGGDSVRLRREAEQPSGPPFWRSGRQAKTCAALQYSCTTRETHRDRAASGGCSAQKTSKQ